MIDFHENSKSQPVFIAACRTVRGTRGNGGGGGLDRSARVLALFLFFFGVRPAGLTSPAQSRRATSANWAAYMAAREGRTLIFFSLSPCRPPPRWDSGMA